MIGVHCYVYTVHSSPAILWFTPHPYLDFRKYCNLINKFGCGSILKQWSDYCCVYVFFSAPINLSFHSSVQHGQGCCNLDDHGRLAVHAASVIVIRRRLLSNGRGGSKSAWWSIWWSSSIENWNAYFLVGGRCTLYFVAHTAAVDKCPGELWVPTLCEVHAALDGTFGVAVVLERREGKEHIRRSI